MPALRHETSLILFSHGSLLCGAGETLRAHAERIRSSDKYVSVEIGYLNYSEPAFEVAVARCAAVDSKRVIIVPYFLVPGYFVETALPPRVAAARGKYPEIEFILAQPIGYSDSMAHAILQVAEKAAPPERWRDDLSFTSQLCEERPECPLFGTPRCPKSVAKVATI
jgi:sirohydrochlorin cobaltochelatase